jgi:hypothetical protein
MSPVISDRERRANFHRALRGGVFRPAFCETQVYGWTTDTDALQTFTDCC